jgi:hypothetical protein
MTTAVTLTTLEYIMRNVFSVLSVPKCYKLVHSGDSQLADSCGRWDRLHFCNLGEADRLPFEAVNK